MRLAHSNARCVRFATLYLSAWLSLACNGGADRDTAAGTTDASSAQDSAPTGTPPGVTSMNPEKACEPIFACGAACPYPLGLALLSSECFALVESTSCSAHTGGSDSYLELCFPPCTSPSASCSDDGNAIECSTKIDGTLRWVTLSCARVCEELGLPYNGACALDGQCGCVQF